MTLFGLSVCWLAWADSDNGGCTVSTGVASVGCGEAGSPPPSMAGHTQTFSGPLLVLYGGGLCGNFSLTCLSCTPDLMWRGELWKTERRVRGGHRYRGKSWLVWEDTGTRGGGWEISLSWTDGRLSVRRNDADNPRNSETLTRRGRGMLDPQWTQKQAMK